MNKHKLKYQKKWNKSSLGKAAKKKYRQSAKGKEAARRARKKYKEILKNEKM